MQQGVVVVVPNPTCRALTATAFFKVFFTDADSVAVLDLPFAQWNGSILTDSFD
jgi:hypothetical protein